MADIKYEIKEKLHYFREHKRLEEGVESCIMELCSSIVRFERLGTGT